GVIFEGLNILVKVKGSEEAFGEKEGVLFSAHFDSVSSGLGLIDDAISIVSLLVFMEYLATHHIKRTAVFNFNHGEEDGLNGAHVVRESLWAMMRMVKDMGHAMLNEALGKGVLRLFISTV
ncbi:hypothetical protein BDQ17DRAFT_1377953, partial [Cyathus striatus]